MNDEIAGRVAPIISVWGLVIKISLCPPRESAVGTPSVFCYAKSSSLNREPRLASLSNEIANRGRWHTKCDGGSHKNTKTHRRSVPVSLGGLL